MGSSQINNVNGSNPGLQINGSNPSLQINGSNPAMPLVSDPSLSSISTIRRRSIVTPIIIVTLLIITTIVTAIGVIRAQKDRKDRLAANAQLEQEANEVKHINAQPLTDSVDAFDDEEEDAANTVFLSLYSVPDGAEIYMNEEYIGSTPIDQMKFKKSDVDNRFVIALDGYEIERRKIAFTESYSDTLSLRPVAVAAPTRTETKPTSGITVNRGVNINSGSAGSGRKKTGSTSAATSDIVLPD